MRRFFTVAAAPPVLLNTLHARLFNSRCGLLVVVYGTTLADWLLIPILLVWFNQLWRYFA
ncbi:hypothetical protein CYLTODRAFT_419793 [Cylindrobasidium torrendii FP15055 ss-10]|uniref:Uncharacterized protein n=1 Tax=Cylindrobasidium torrendii FP15055 ss-10 TaxID=1314674 RepID=A0A0D7BK03_9AGAR|nr:hypothetical protein CYLTODRAFT_419793 [Cylindrobasidium torrendii FP15055 ss-10]